MYESKFGFSLLYFVYRTISWADWTPQLPTDLSIQAVLRKDLCDVPKKYENQN